MPSRREIKYYKPRRLDGWEMCESVTGACSCLKNGSGPCSAWVLPLKACYKFGLDPASAERARLAYNVAKGTMHRLPADLHFDFIKGATP